MGGDRDRARSRGQKGGSFSMRRTSRDVLIELRVAPDADSLERQLAPCDRSAVVGRVRTGQQSGDVRGGPLIRRRRAVADEYADVGCDQPVEIANPRG